MQSRVYAIVAGVETSVLPDPGTPSQPSDIVPFGYFSSNVPGDKVVTGTVAAPYVPATAATSIAHALTSSDDECLMFIEGPSSGILDLSSATQIAVGTKLGQRLVMLHTSDTKRIKYENGNGLLLTPEIASDEAIQSVLGTKLEFHWDGSLWRLTQWNRVGDLG